MATCVGSDSDEDTYILLRHLPEHQKAQWKEQDLSVIIKEFEGFVRDPDLAWKDVVNTRRNLQNYMELQLRFTVEQKAHVTDLLWQLFVHEKIPFAYQAKLAETIGLVLKGKVPGLCRRHSFSWKVVRDIITKIHLRNPQEGELPAGGLQVMRFHESALLGLAKVMRWYFDYDVVMLELVDEYAGLFENALSKDIFVAQTMIELFAPPAHFRESEQRFDNQAFVERIIKCWWPLVAHCPAWDHIWFSLLRRIGKYDQSINWDPHLPFLFQKIQGALSITIGGKKASGLSFRVRPSRLLHTLGNREGRHVAKLAILLIGSGSAKEYYAVPKDNELSSLMIGSEAEVKEDLVEVKREIDSCLEEEGDLSAGFLYLRRFICAISTLFHPSNQGRNSFVLSGFLNFLCAGFVKRLGRGVRPMKSADKKAFLPLMLPLLKMCLASKNEIIVIMAQSVLRHLAWVAPQTVVEDLESFLLRGLDPHNLNQIHKAPAAMKALEILTQPLLHAKLVLPALLPTLLPLTLPGIDPNDVNKSIVTLRLYDSILQWIPIVDTSQFRLEDKPAVDELSLYRDPTDSREFKLDPLRGEEDEAKELVKARDAMWAAGPGLAMWALEALDRVLYLFRSIGERSKNNESEYSMEGTKIYQVGVFFRALFVQLDPVTRRKAEDKVKRWVLDNCYVNALKELKALMRSCFRASDNQQALLADLLSSLQSRVKNTLSKIQLLWAFTILGAVTRVAGTHLVAHIEALKEIIDKGLSSDDKEVRSLAMKLLRRTLKGLTDAYVLGASSIERTRIEEEGWAHVAVRWGYTPNWDKVSPVYHNASDEEKAAADELKSCYLSRSMSVMEEMVAKGDKNRFQWRTQLRLVYYLLRGACFLLSEAERCELMERMCVIIEWLLTEHESDTLTHRRSLKVLWILVLYRGGKFHSAEPDLTYNHGILTRLSQSTALHAKLREVARRKKEGNSEQRHEAVVYSRRAMILTVSILSFRYTQQEMFDKANSQRDSASYIKVLELLMSASMHEWTDTRIAAQAIFRSISLRFPTFMKRKTPVCLDSLVVNGMEDTPGRADAQLTGSIYLLCHKNILRWIVTNWDLLDKFVRKLVMEAEVTALSSEKQNSANILIQGMMLHVFQSWNTIPLWTEANVKTWKQLVEDLSTMPFNACSWRKQLSIAGCLTVLIRQDVDTPESMWRWFITGVKSSSIPVQVTCAFALARLLMVNKTAFDLNLLKPELLDPEFLETLLRVISENRRLVPTADGTSKTRAKWSVGVAEFMNLGKVRKSAGWYPQNRTKTESKKFNFSHTQVTLYLTLRFRADFLRPVLPILEHAIVQKYGTSDHENHLAGGTEAVAGILLAQAKLNDPVVETLVRKEVLPMILGSLNQQSLSFSISWIGAARYCSTYRMNQAAFIQAGLHNMEDQLKSYDRPASWSFASTINSIRLMRVLFVEADETREEFKATKERMETILIRSIRHPFKTVRHEVGDCIAAVIDKVVTSLGDHETARRFIEKLLAACAKKDICKDVPCNGDTEEGAGGQMDLLAAETTLATTTKLVQLGGYEEYCVLLLPGMLRTTHTTNLELNKLGKAVAARTPLTVDTHGAESIAILNREGLLASSWQLRHTAVSMEGVFMTRHAVSMGIVRTTCVRKSLERMLGDPKSEVNRAAMVAVLFIMTAMHAGSSHFTALISKFIALTKVPKKGASTVEEESETKRADAKKLVHIGVLGLAAIVGAFPYSVPWTEPIVRLASLCGRTDAAGRDAKLAVEEFKRTHFDTWDSDKLKFSALELEDLEFSYSGREGYA